MLQEIAHYRRFKRLSTQDRSIVFYAEHSGYYPYFEGIIEKLTDEYNRTLCYITSDSHDPILTNSDPRIKTFYLNKLLPFFMAFVDCRVFVMTLTDLDNFHLKRSANPVHYVFVPHGLLSTHMVVHGNAYDHYDCIFCTGPHRIKEIRRREQLNNLPPKTLIEAGYYRLERIHQDYQDYIHRKPSQVDRETILIAPSWGAANILESCGEELVGLLLQEGYQVIVRPHPETVRRNPRLIKQLEDRFGKKPNFTLEKSVVTIDSLLQADVLITDWSGISLEYAFGTERPVLFLDVPTKVHNPRYMEIGIEPLEMSIRSEIGIIVSPGNLDLVPLKIHELLEKSLLYKKHLVDLRNQHIYNFGKSSEIGARYIMNVVER
jgi:YidC/Oxa1 family membrane protein insertase